MNNLGTLFGLYAVVVVQDQTGGALAARHAGLETVALYHPQWHIGVKAGFGARRSALVEHKAPLHWTAHSWGRQAERKQSQTVKLETAEASTAQHQVTFQTHRTETSSSTAARRRPPCSGWRRPPVCRTDTRRCWLRRRTGRTRRRRTRAPEAPRGGRA